ncbi:MAG: polysaccharide biosynthesis/export family protein, partial [Bryobacteraceae bacterium]
MQQALSAQAARRGSKGRKNSADLAGPRESVVRQFLQSRVLTVFFFSLALAAGLFAQDPAQEKKQEEQELGPATRDTKSEAADSVKTEPELPKVSAAAPVDPKSYIIGAEDILMVRVWREPELSSGAQVRPDGKITLPLIGDVQAAGKTPQQLTE